jgi:hypothetical protein
VNSERPPAQRSPRAHYIWSVWIKRFALPIVVFTVVLGILDFDLTAKQIFSWRFLSVVLLTGAVAALGAVWLGKHAWRKPLLRPPDDSSE